ncbi:hypothetical protein CN557_27010 [Bacillus wiedmannii]|uniref:hypothetical protein n=1 Tax=Bacillus cereus group TaxID=86661 RepID=UPI000BFA6D7A|nr:MULTISPECIES: hypothetical protein [Bacillus cereus group]PEP48932.1 hypothetical protein CN557_27010 [Bacillus wiedmannii]
MILPQLMIDIESSRESNVEYDVEVETLSGKNAVFTIKLSDFGHESKIQEQVTSYIEDAEDKNEFALFKNGVSLRIGDIVYIKVNEGSDLPF